MNLAWLTTFKRVSETGSYTRVADTQFISQPAISQQIRQLERFFGVRLIDRVGRSFELTDAGKLVYELACRMENDLDSTRLSLRELLSDSAGVITVAGGSAALIHYMPPVLRRFWSQYPHIAVRTIARSGPEIPNAVRTGTADLGIHSSFYLDRSLPASLMCVNPIVAVCSSSHPLANVTAIPPDDLSQHRVAMTRVGTERRRLIDSWFGERGIILRNVMELSSPEEVRAAARENLAIGLLTKPVVADDIAAGILSQLDMNAFQLSVPLYVTHRADLNEPANFLLTCLMSFHTDASYTNAEPSHFCL